MDPNDPNSANLRDALYSLKTGITTLPILTVLFNIYVIVNHVDDRDKPSYLIANPEMYHYFRNTFAKLQNKPQKYEKDRVTWAPDLTKPIPKFNPNYFRYSEIRNIISDNILKPFSPEYDYRYETPDMNALKRDLEIVSKAFFFHNLKFLGN